MIVKDASLEDKQKFRDWIHHKLELRFPFASIRVTNRQAMNKIDVDGSDEDKRFYTQEVTEYVAGCFAVCPWDWVRPPQLK